MPRSAPDRKAKSGTGGSPEVNSNLPLVSIVIPTYNHAHYLDEAITSILNQDYPNIELIVLDDGSTDNTRGVLEKYKGIFYWETHENMGQASTLNKGWKMSKGEVLAYLSADDILLPSAVSTSIEYLLANPDTVSTYCNYNLIDENSAVIRRVEAPEFNYRDMVVKLACPPGPGAFFLRGASEAVGFWNVSLRLILDYDHWLKLGLQGSILKIPEVLAAFRVHSDSQTFSEADELKSEEYIRVISDYYQFQHVPANVRAAKVEALSNAYIFAARAHLRSRRYKKGFARLLKGLYLYPANLSIHTLRIITHGFLNHIRHRILSRLARIFPK